jgi:two-component system, chemotaxis family, chemotaxis protein CheY
MTDTAAVRVLVVDDDPDVLEVVGDLLADEGYAVSTARNGAEALEQAGRAPPDLILLDMIMPVMDGWAFAREYGQLPGPRAPIIVTAATFAEDRARQIGAAAHCAKPFEADTLLALVRQHTITDRQA